VAFYVVGLYYDVQLTKSTVLCISHVLDYNFYMLQERELESFCYECGLKIITDEAGCKVLPAKQSLNLPKSGFQSYGLTKFEIFQRYLMQFVCRSLFT